MLLHTEKSVFLSKTYAWIQWDVKLSIPQIQRCFIQWEVYSW
ncbi:unnamed protein product [Callosobruchus maculatus]|uniref:Uncharacterized protein n=1 Tax=Callosobruchus maculatus TaxID=64391 RepID=A0A653DN85_CALMS|nr:unnamed protein product [Callosobruchus maculatus]